MELVGVYYTLLDTEEGGAEDWTLTINRLVAIKYNNQFQMTK